MKLPADQLAKTSFGLIESLDELFEGFLYCRQETALHQGTWSVKPAGWHFMSGINTFERVITFPPGHRHPGPCLYTKPAAKTMEAMERRAMMDKGDFSFDLRTRKGPGYDDGVTLVMGTDYTMIPNVWLAFIETDKLPAINPENTKIWTPGDPA